MAGLAGLRPRHQLPAPVRVGQHALRESLVAAKQNGRRLAEQLALAMTEESLERRVRVRECATLAAGIEEGDRETASAERGARQGAVGEQPEQRRRRVG